MNAASIAALMLATEALVADIQEEEMKATGAGGHGGGTRRRRTYDVGNWQVEIGEFRFRGNALCVPGR